MLDLNLAPPPSEGGCDWLPRCRHLRPGEAVIENWWMDVDKKKTNISSIIKKKRKVSLCIGLIFRFTTRDAFIEEDTVRVHF